MCVYSALPHCATLKKKRLTICPMSTHITGKNIELTQAITQYVEQKVASFHQLAQDIIAIDVELDVDKHHKNGPVHHVRMNVQIPHQLIHAEETKEDVYAAVDVCKDEVERQLRKVKTKYEAKQRRSQKTRRALKSILTLWNR